MLPQIIKILHVLFKKQKIKKGKDPKEIENKRPGACVQNLPGVVPYLAVATCAVARPPRARSSVLAEPPRAWIRCAPSPLTCALTSRSRSRAVEPANPNPSYAAPPRKLRCRLAGVAGHHCPIAWASSCASSSSTSSPSHASRDAAVASSSSFHRRYLRRSSSSIPAPSSHPEPRRHLHCTPGERANPGDPFPLFLAP